MVQLVYVQIHIMIQVEKIEEKHIWDQQVFILQMIQDAEFLKVALGKDGIPELIKMSR